MQLLPTGLIQERSNAAFRLACHSPLCHFNGNMCTTAQIPLATQGMGWPSGKQCPTNRLATLLLCPQQQIQGCLFFKKIWIIPQRYASSAKFFPKFFPNFQSYRCILTRGVDQSLTWGMILCCAFGGVWGDVPPSEAGKFCIFWN